MAFANQLLARNVHIYDSKDETTELAGFFIAQPLTNTFVYNMLDILVVPIIFPKLGSSLRTRYWLVSQKGVKIERNADVFQEGHYFLKSPCEVLPPFDSLELINIDPISLTNEVPMTRLCSLHTGTQHHDFARRIHSRASSCIISGREVPEYASQKFYEGFHAAHVFPLAYEGVWLQEKYYQWITDVPKRGGSINSVQNGILLSAEVHELFDTYELTIDPDSYHVICLHPSALRYGGRRLNQEFIDNPLRPPDSLLRWHFRQAVLTKMKAAGEPSFDHDVQPGDDIMEQICKGPKAKERMEFELFSRLGAHMQVLPSPM